MYVFFTKLNLYDHLSRFQCIGEKISFFVFSRSHFAYFSTNLVEIFSYHVQKYLFSLCRCFITLLAPSTGIQRTTFLWSYLYIYITLIYTTSISRNSSSFHNVQGGSFFYIYPRMIKLFRTLTLLLVVTAAPYMTQVEDLDTII